MILAKNLCQPSVTSLLKICNIKFKFKCMPAVMVLPCLHLLCSRNTFSDMTKLLRFNANSYNLIRLLASQLGILSVFYQNRIISNNCIIINFQILIAQYCLALQSCIEQYSKYLKNLYCQQTQIFVYLCQDYYKKQRIFKRQ